MPFFVRNPGENISSVKSDEIFQICDWRKIVTDELFTDKVFKCKNLSVPHFRYFAQCHVPPWRYIIIRSPWFSIISPRFYRKISFAMMSKSEDTLEDIYTAAAIGDVLWKGVLKNFANLRGKHLYQSFCLNKTAGFLYRTPPEWLLLYI